MGKVVIINMSESGKQIGEKLIDLLDEKKRQELIRFFINIENDIYNKESLKFSEIKMFIDSKRYELSYQDKRILLTKAEYRVLEALMNKPSWVFTKEQIYEMVYDEPAEQIDNAVMCLIHSIRKKLNQHTGKEFIQTVRGVGYRFVIPEE